MSSLLAVPRAPQQARSRASLARILDAAEALMESRSLDAATVADIAGRAGVSIGSFYKRFASKDAVLEALYARYEEQRTEHLNVAFAPARWTGHGLEERARGLTSALVEMFSRRRGIIRAFVMHRRGRPGPLEHGMSRRLEAIYQAGADIDDALAARRAMASLLHPANRHLGAGNRRHPMEGTLPFRGCAWGSRTTIRGLMCNSSSGTKTIRMPHPA